MPQSSSAVSRTEASGRNLRTALVGQLLITAVNILSRRIFIRLLGSEYAGFSGLCGHLLNFLSILEPGFDMSCAFALYRPLALGDKILVSQICLYLKKVYRKIALLSFFAGLALFPAAVCLSRDSIDMRSISVIWLLSVIEMSSCYLFSHRRILPVSDQKGYVVTSYGYIFFIISQFLRLVVLVHTENYICYLCTGIAVGLCEEMLLYRKIGKMYPFLPYTPCPLPNELQRAIKKDVCALFFHKIGTILCGSVDNMSVFLFLGLHGGAMYSNYTMLLGTCLSFIGIMTGAVSASIGNLGVTANTERMQRVYKAAYFVVFFAASLLSLSLYFTYPLIVRVWMGEEMVLGNTETALFCLSLFISALRRPTGVFLDSYGLFEKEKYKSVIEAAISCAVTLTLAPKFGITGVLIGQIMGAAAFPLWFEPYILYKYGFGETFRNYLKMTLQYLTAPALSAVLSAVLCASVSRALADTALEIAARIAVCAISCVCVFGIMFFDSRTMHEAARYARRMSGKA